EGSEKELLELKLLSDCIDEAPNCMAAIARDLGADLIVFGNIDHRADGTYAIWLRSLVTETKKAGPHTLVVTLAPTEANEATMRDLAAQVCPDPRAVARDTTLVVETDAAEGVILVNGISRGTITAGKPTVIRGLPPGPAKVEVQ